MNSKQTPLTIIMGRAASGKDTLADRIKDKDRTMVLSHTTRQKRAGEEDTHIFIDTIEPFNDRWLETEINGHHYFIQEEDLYNHDILLVDPKGFLELIKKEQFTRPYQMFYIDTPLPTRRERYLQRDHISEKDFIKRNSDEDLQFSNFEELLCEPEYRAEHNIQILKDDDDLYQAVQSIRYNIDLGKDKNEALQQVGEAKAVDPAITRDDQ